MHSIILRFRDLVTPPNGTIEEHQKLIQNNKYVYWGWWKKAGEKCPSIFNKIEETIDNIPETVLLFDSGQSKIYQATMIDLDFSSKPGGIDCPGPDNTPDYCRSRPFTAWFKFNEIVEVKKEDIKRLLNQYSYRDENFGLFENSVSFSDFYNKRVISTEELRHQDRTVWFLTKFDATTHDDHEIILHNSNSVNPAVFPTNYTKVYSNKIHWLTDLHFSDGNNQHGFDDKLLTNPLESIIEKIFKDSMNCLLVSGDMTWKATESEFSKTLVFYQNLVSVTKLSFDKIGFCPGNHDLSFAEQMPEQTIDALTKYQEIQRGGTEKLTGDEINRLKAVESSEITKSGYESHFEKVTSIVPNDYLSMGKKYLLDQQRPVEICFLNSNRMEQFKALFQGHGFVGQDQRDDAEKKMGWDKKKAFGALRIVVLHHNLLPVEYARVPYLGASPGSLVYDAQATIKWCYKNDVDVILHGHTHQRSIFKLHDHTSESKKSVWIIGLGSTGVHSKHLVQGHNNQLAELDFSQKNISIQFFEITDNEIKEDGKAVILD